MDATRITEIDTMDAALRKALPTQDKYAYVLEQTGMSAYSVQLYPWDDPVQVARGYIERRKNHKVRRVDRSVLDGRCGICGRTECSH